MPPALSAILEQVEERYRPVLMAAFASGMMKIVERHLADPQFQGKMQTWLADAQSKEGGSLEDLTKSSHDLFALMGS